MKKDLLVIFYGAAWGLLIVTVYFLLGIIENMLNL
jgi:hypothetical protein